MLTLAFGFSGVALGEVPESADDEEAGDASLYRDVAESSEATSDEAETSDEAIEDDEEALSFALGWPEVGDGIVVPSLELAAPDVEDLSYTVTYRLVCGGEEVSWDEGPYEAAALQVLELTIDYPADTWFSDAQMRFPSTLTVIAYATSAEGEVVLGTEAPPVRALWASSSGEPTLYEPDALRAAPEEWVASVPELRGALVETVQAQEVVR